jgi:hypothetical protein
LVVELLSEDEEEDPQLSPAHLRRITFTAYPTTFATFSYPGYFGDLCYINSALVAAAVTTATTSVTMYHLWTATDCYSTARSTFQ